MKKSTSPTLSTREKILQAAVELLEKSGIKSMTQLNVAKEVGIPQGQLTYHFPKRSDLILAVTDLAVHRIADLILKNSQKASEKTESQLFNLMWDVTRNFSRARALLGLMVEADENPEVRAKLLEQEERARTLIALSLGIENEDPLVTNVHATLIGFGVLAFVRAEKEGNLKNDFIATIKSAKKEAALQKRKK
jgi:AcrR family transcriptional regulator